MCFHARHWEVLETAAGMELAYQIGQFNGTYAQIRGCWIAALVAETKA